MTTKKRLMEDFRRIAGLTDVGTIMETAEGEQSESPADVNLHARHHAKLNIAHKNHDVAGSSAHENLRRTNKAYAREHFDAESGEEDVLGLLHHVSRKGLPQAEHEAVLSKLAKAHLSTARHYAVMRDEAAKAARTPEELANVANVKAAHRLHREGQREAEGVRDSLYPAGVDVPDTKEEAVFNRMARTIMEETAPHSGEELNNLTLAAYTAHMDANQAWDGYEEGRYDLHEPQNLLAHHEAYQAHKAALQAHENAGSSDADKSLHKDGLEELGARFKIMGRDPDTLELVSPHKNESVEDLRAAGVTADVDPRKVIAFGKSHTAKKATKRFEAWADHPAFDVGNPKHLRKAIRYAQAAAEAHREAKFAHSDLGVGSHKTAYHAGKEADLVKQAHIFRKSLANTHSSTRADREAEMDKNDREASMGREYDAEGDPAEVNFDESVLNQMLMIVESEGYTLDKDATAEELVNAVVEALEGGADLSEDAQTELIALLEGATILERNRENKLRKDALKKEVNGEWGDYSANGEYEGTPDSEISDKAAKLRNAKLDYKRNSEEMSPKMKAYYRAHIPLIRGELADLVDAPKLKNAKKEIEAANPFRKKYHFSYSK